MFGYIKLDKKSPPMAKDLFKKNYCMLCRAIEKNYGQLSRLFLSYDVTFLLMLFTESAEMKDINKVKCFKTDRLIRDRANRIKKFAALNLAMAQAELYDHLSDDKSLFAKILLAIYKKPFNKVKEEYPDMWKTLIDGYAKFDEYERANKSLVEIEDMFAELIVGIAEDEFEIHDEYRLSQLAYVAKWLYFIDACDDLDKDIRSGAFNALKEYKSRNLLINEHYAFINFHINSIMNGITLQKAKDINRYVTDRIVFCGIPESTYKVMSKAK